MKFTAAASVASLAAMVNAKAQFTNSAFSIVAGQPFNLTWSDSDGTGPFTISLKTGPSNNLVTYQTLTTTSDFSFVFTPDATMPSGQYAFQIDDSTSEPNYSASWAFQGSAASSSSSAASSTAATTSTSSSSSSSSTAATTSSSSSSQTSTSTGRMTSITSSSNSTATTASSSKTGTATTSSSSTATTSRAATTSVANTSGVQRISSSPLALLLGAVAGLVFFN